MSAKERAVAAAVEDLVSAVRHEGARPDYHRSVLSRHRKEWPRLWEAIDKVLEARDGG